LANGLSWAMIQAQRRRGLAVSGADRHSVGWTELEGGMNRNEGMLVLWRHKPNLPAEAQHLVDLLGAQAQVAPCF